MMDFLRRLAPPRETDASRAFAVLPSRFASENPLQATMAQDRPAQHPDDDEASISPDAALPPAANNTLAAQRPPVTSVQPSQATPRPLASEPTRRDNEKATSPAYAPAEAPGIHVADPRVVQNRHGENPERARPTSPESESLAATLAATHGLQNVTAPPAQARVALPLSQAILAQRTLQSRDDSQVVHVTIGHPEPQGLAATLAATHGLQNVTAPPAQARVALPLSQAILAQRTFQSRDDNQVVHVTIGRIDVVASPAPGPAVQRSPVPRQATVTLADYLRGSNGGRQ